MDLNWRWHLISLEWLPEILGSFDCLIEPSWQGLKRNMLRGAVNKKFGNRMFGQLKSLLIDTSLVSENNGHIISNVYPNRTEIQIHLRELFNVSNDPWANAFRHLFNIKRPMIYNDLSNDILTIFPDLSNYSIYRQWANYFQFIGYGFLLSHDSFIPASGIVDLIERDERFVNKCFMAIVDPRFLTGAFSLHSNADYLAWTRGEDLLPITTDTRLEPRIPLEIVNENLNIMRISDTPELFSDNLMRAGRIWSNYIGKILNLAGIENIEELLLSCKLLIDYFIFGRDNMTDDHIDTDTLNTARNLWNSVPHFTVSGGIWDALPNAYRDVTKLCWGILYFRNSLRKPNDLNGKCNPQAIEKVKFIELRKLSIRCAKSRRTLNGLLMVFSSLNNSISRLQKENIHKKYQDKAETIFKKAYHFLPSDKLEAVVYIKELEELISLQSFERQHLLKSYEFDFHSNVPSNTTLQVCYWINKFNKLTNSSHIKTILNVRNQLEGLKMGLIQEISLYNSKNNLWQDSCLRIKRILKDYRPDNYE
jgi:hypothetical protein